MHANLFSWVARLLSPFSVNAVLSNLLLYMLMLAYIVLFHGCLVVLYFFTELFPVGDFEIAFVSPWWVYLVTLLLVTPTLLPVHQWLRSHVNTVIYGEYDDPYSLLAETNALLQEMNAPRLELPLVAASIARALKLSYVAIDVTPVIGTGMNQIAPLNVEFGAPMPHGEIAKWPLRYLDRYLGELSVGSRHANEPLSEVEHGLLGDAARQIAIALHVIQLSADLQASRERLVIGREEERRRIRNDLHDGLGPTLSALQLQLGALHTLIRQQPEVAEQVAKELQSDLRQVTTEIRQLVYALRPPLLDEMGLVEALQALHPLNTGEKRESRDEAFALEVNVPERLPKLSAALEVAIYRIASEAIHNTVRHAQATRCVVTLTLLPGTALPREASTNRLQLVISDNGRGFPVPMISGVGLASMRERAAELSGTVTVLSSTSGVIVTAVFPLGIGFVNGIAQIGDDDNADRKS